jgi:hypothetical protein
MDWMNKNHHHNFCESKPGQKYERIFFREPPQKKSREQLEPVEIYSGSIYRTLALERPPAHTKHNK